jgi:type IV pilus assembly protein PilY1
MTTLSVVVRMLILALMCHVAVVRTYADDTCTFMTTANDIPPNIVILLDNGAAMEEIVWHSGYNSSINYTPNPATKSDIVVNSVGNGFYWDKGYSVIKQGNDYYLVEIPDNLVVANHQFSRKADGAGNSPIWSINGRTITLPVAPSKSEVNGVIDNATNFRYSKNYLNWLFYYNYSSDTPSILAYDGSTLPDKTRFYYAKKALMTIAKMAANKASLSIYNFTANASGATNVQPLGLVVNTPLAANPEDNTLNSSYVNNINNMGTVTYSPLAEGLASIGGYYSSPSSHVVGYYCQKNFALVVSPGLSSEDKSPAAGSTPSSFSDYDSEISGIVEGIIRENSTDYTIPVNQNGTTWLDDVACYLYKNDIVGYQPGFQNVRTYTVGFMGDKVGNLFLINTSNNGNGNFNLYDTTHKDYGKYHYVAQNPDELAAKLLEAVNDIISQTNSFTAPVVPVTRTTSGNRIYMAFFKPDKDNFWEGNVTKFGLSASLGIVDSMGNPATYPNGAIIDDAKPYWQTKDWANPEKTNYVHNSIRKIYTYLGTTKDLTDSANAFKSDNITLTHLGNPNPIRSKDQIINYIRGADVFDQDKNTNTTENRIVITGDVLHSEPLVFHYRYSNGSAKSYVFFGSNDGMLHAVKDADVNTSGIETNYGEEAWAFIPPDLLPKLKNIVEGTSHQYYVDSSPKAYFKDNNGDGIIDREDKVILVCGERKGGSSYFALDITNPDSPQFLWRIDNTSSTIIPAPDRIISDLGQSWSEPQFGLVKTTSTDTVGTPVLFIGGGYSSNNSSGKAILAIKVLTGEVLKTFKNDSVITTMNYSIPSNVLVVDANDNGFVDKVYIGDLGSQMWRLGKFTNSSGVAFTFPDCNENINDWQAQIVFVADTLHTRFFYYPPSITLERGYDLLFVGTGDRENACSTSTLDRFYCIRDKHQFSAYSENDLVDMTNPVSTKPTLDNLSADVNNDGRFDQGWFIQLAAGEKVLAENTVFYKTVYLTTFTPNPTPCVPGGDARVYAMQYKTTGNVLDYDKDGTKERSAVIGGGIPSKTVMVITDTLVPAKMLISVGSTNPDGESESFAAGVIGIDPLAPDANFLYRWWRDLTNL